MRRRPHVRSPSGTTAVAANTYAPALGKRSEFAPDATGLHRLPRVSREKSGTTVGVPEGVPIPYSTAASLVEEARALVENLTAAQVAEELEGDVLLVDLREPEELLAQGRIAGSIRAPRGVLEFWADPTHHRHRTEFHPSRRIILYSASGDRSALAASTMQELGYRRVVHLDGGLEAWRKAGYPVERA